MSLIDMSQFDRVQFGGSPSRVFLGPSPADATAATVRTHPGRSVVAMRDPGGDPLPGTVGPVHPTIASRIGLLLRRLAPHGRLPIMLTSGLERSGGRSW